MPVQVPQQKFAAQLKSLPAKPGVYIFKNAKGDILYVGRCLAGIPPSPPPVVEEILEK